MALKRSKRRTPPRAASGRFLKRHHRASGKAPRRKVRRHRRSNPTMMPLVVANPARKVHRKRHAAPHRKVPTLRRKRRSHYLEGKFRPRLRHRRRSNPTMMPMSLRSLLMTGAAGMAGIIASRIARNLYNQYVSQYVAVPTDPTSWRNWLNDLLQVVAGEVGVIALERIGKKAGLSPQVRLAFLVGGTAESVRTLAGLGLNRLSPTIDKRMLGLDGMGALTSRPVAYLAPDGSWYQFNAQKGEYVLEGIVPKGQLAGLLGKTEFAAS